MLIYDIAILSKNEYEKYKDLIVSTNETWWLKDSDNLHQPIAVCCYDNSITKVLGIDCERYIRPVLYIKKMDVSIGSKMEIFSENWTVLDIMDDKMIVLCDRCVGLSRYSKISSDYETSLVKIYLNRWLSKRQKCSNTKKQESFIKKEKLIKKFLSTDILRYWIGPICLLIPLIVLCLCCHNILDKELPLLLYVSYAMHILSLICLCFASAQTLFIVCGPHTDTGLRHILNIVLLIFVTIYFRNTTNLFELCLFIFTIIFFFINRRYLSEIKYIS